MMNDGIRIFIKSCLAVHVIKSMHVINFPTNLLKVNTPTKKKKRGNGKKWRWGNYNMNNYIRWDKMGDVVYIYSGVHHPGWVTFRLFSNEIPDYVPTCHPSGFSFGDCGALLFYMPLLQRSPPIWLKSN